MMGADCTVVKYHFSFDCQFIYFILYHVQNTIAAFTHGPA